MPPPYVWRGLDFPTPRPYLLASVSDLSALVQGESTTEARVKAGGGRRKGHDFERLIASRFRSLWPGAKRGLQGRGGIEAPDVTGTPFHIEAKRGRTPNIRKAYEQAIAEHTADSIPIVVSKADNGPILVTLSLDDFLGGRWLAQEG